MHFSTEQENFHEEFKELLLSLLQIPNIKLHIANSIWAQKDFVFMKEYFSLIEENYLSEIQLVDFKEQSEKSRVKINKWVEEKTEKKIQNLLKQGVINTDTRMVIANAIYFLGNWAKQFDENYTESTTFKALERLSNITNGKLVVGLLNELPENVYGIQLENSQETTYLVWSYNTYSFDVKIRNACTTINYAGSLISGTVSEYTTLEFNSEMGPLYITCPK